VSVPVHRGVSIDVPEGDALTTLLDRADETGAARRLLAGLSGAARDGMLKLFARLYQTGVEDGIDRSMELRGTMPAPPSVPSTGPASAAPPAGQMRSPVQAVVERYRSSELTLPSPPDVAMRLNRIVEEADFEIASVVELVRSEPTLTAKVMGLASSPAYSLSGKTPRSLNDAVMRVGSRDLTKFLMALCNRRVFAARGEWSAEALRDLWHHSLATAILSELLADDVPGLVPAQLFLHGLLHDIGRAVLVQIFDEMSADPEYEGAFGAEEIARTIDGLHGQFGSALLQKWRFADSFTEVAMFHHTPQKSFAHQNVVAVVALADVVAGRLGFGGEAHDFASANLADHPSARHLGLSAEQIDYASQQMRRSYDSMVDVA